MRLNLLATCAAIAMVPNAALAQTSPTAPPSDSSSPTAAPVNANGLGDIIVTAQRRAESSQRAAIAIDVVTGAAIAAAGITNANDLSKAVPSLTIQSIGPSNTSFIRGVGNFSVSVTADPAVAFNYDGVYLGRQTATSGTFFDLDRVEVLKGPQGTLYGRNATAGVINVLPAQPKLGKLGGYAALSYGNYNALNAEGAINLPIGTQTALRLSGVVTDRDGYLNDGTSDNKSHAARLQLKSNLTPDLTVRLAGDYTHLGGEGVGFTFVDRQLGNALTQVYTIIPTNLSRNEGPTSPASQAFFTSLPAGAGAGIAGRKRDPFPALFQNSDFYGVNAEIGYNAGFGTLTIVPAYRWDHVRNRNGAGGFPITNDQKDNQFSLEARFAGKVGLLDYTLGGYYFAEDNLLRAGTVTFGSSLSFAGPTHQKVKSWAPFGRLVAHVSDQLRLVGGIRYTHDSKQLNSFNPSISVSCTRSLALGGCPDIVLPPSVATLAEIPFAIPSGPGSIPGPTPFSLVSRSEVSFNSHLSNHKITWRGAVEYDVAPASMLYASVETGFRSGGFNTLVGFETFQPEFITAYTLGSKNRFLDNRLQFNVEAFYWKYRNQQTSHPSLDRLFRPGSLTENIGKSTIKGIEVDARLKVTRNTSLGAIVEYLDAKQKDFSYSQPLPLGTLTTCAVSPSPVAAIPPRIIVNCSGKPSYNSPKWTMNLSAEQTIPLGENKIMLGVDTQYKSKRYMGFEYQPQQLQGSSWTTNAHISFGPTNENWSLSAFVRNIENDRLLLAPFVFGGVSEVYTTAPRTYGIRASAKF